MTDETSEFDWKQVFGERGYDANEVEGPTGRESGDELEWFQTMTRFTQRGFLRVIAASDGPDVKVELQVALPGGDDADYLDALKTALEVTAASLEVLSAQRPWTLDLVVSESSSLNALLDKLEQVSEHVRQAEAGEEISTLAASLNNDSEQTSTDEDAGTQDDEAREQSSGTPFEAIGDDEPEAATQAVAQDERDQDDSRPRDADNSSGEPRRARLGAFSLSVSNENVVVRAEADSTAQEQSLDALARSLRSKLETRFDLVTNETTVDPAEDSVTLTMTPSRLGATYGMPLGELCDDVARYLDRQRQLAEMGVSLESVSPNRPPTRSDKSSPRQSAAGRRERVRSERPSTGREPADEDDGGVVFGFGEEEIAAASPTESSVDPGDYTDARVMREDATTALVDVVLRHPGYSDRNMRQVLSILLDIDYFRAGKLIDQAPCVIAWGVGQERAQEFKRVIERSGGRVTLVEPDTLADAE